VSLADLTAIGLLSGFPEPMLVIQPDGTLIFANDAAARLLEVEAAAVSGLITDYLPENERSRLNPLAWLQRWAETPDAPEMDFVHLTVRTAGGRELPARVRVGRLREGDESLYVVMLQDISKDQSRQQQTRSAHRLAARVLAISADAIVTVNPELVISYANPSAETLFGYGSGELPGRPLADLLPERFRAGHADQIARFGAEARPARLMGERAEVAGLTKSGEELALEASITKVTIDGDVYFSAHLRDLRARKAVEQRLAETRASLRTVFDHAIQAMALIDPDGRVLEINRSARQLLPAGTEAIGADFASLPFWSDDPAAAADRLRAAMAQCLAGNTYRITTAIRLPDGRERTLDFSLTPVRDQDQPFAVIAEARDLTAVVPKS
jgi:PAS domain S-box-containing protein